MVTCMGLVLGYCIFAGNELASKMVTETEGKYFLHDILIELEKVANTSKTNNMFTQLLFILVVGTAAWYISGCFLNVYNMAIETIFVSYLEDLERNDGTRE